MSLMLYLRLLCLEPSQAHIVDHVIMCYTHVSEITKVPYNQTGLYYCLEAVLTILRQTKPFESYNYPIMSCSLIIELYAHQIHITSHY